MNQWSLIAHWFIAADKNRHFARARISAARMSRRYIHTGERGVLGKKYQCTRVYVEKRNEWKTRLSRSFSKQHIVIRHPSRNCVMILWMIHLALVSSMQFCSRWGSTNSWRRCDYVNTSLYIFETIPKRYDMKSNIDGLSHAIKAIIGYAWCFFVLYVLYSTLIKLTVYLWSKPVSFTTFIFRIISRIKWYHIMNASVSHLIMNISKDTAAEAPIRNRIQMIISHNYESLNGLNAKKHLIDCSTIFAVSKSLWCNL